MKVQFDGLIRILRRKLNYEYSKEEIAEIVERDGASSLYKDVEYLGFGLWDIKM